MTAEASQTAPMPSRRLRPGSISPSMVILIVIVVVYLLLALYAQSPLPLRLTKGTSMEPSFSQGDVVLVRRTSFSDINVGDVVAFKTPQAFAGTTQGTILHRVVDIGVIDGDLALTTKGDNSGIDPFPVRPEDLRGKAVLRVKYVGWPIAFLTSRRGILFISLATLLSLLYIPAFIVFYSTVLRRGDDDEETTAVALRSDRTRSDLLDRLASEQVQTRSAVTRLADSIEDIGRERSYRSAPQAPPRERYRSSSGLNEADLAEQGITSSSRPSPYRSPYETDTPRESAREPVRSEISDYDEFYGPVEQTETQPPQTREIAQRPREGTEIRRREQGLARRRPSSGLQPYEELEDTLERMASELPTPEDTQVSERIDASRQPEVTPIEPEPTPPVEPRPRRTPPRIEPSPVELLPNMVERIERPPRSEPPPEIQPSPIEEITPDEPRRNRQAFIQLSDDDLEGLDTTYEWDDDDFASEGMTSLDFDFSPVDLDPPTKPIFEEYIRALSGEYVPPVENIRDVPADELEDVLSRIVGQEMPVHIADVVSRIGNYYGLPEDDSRLRRQAYRTVDELVSQGRIRWEPSATGGFGGSSRRFLLAVAEFGADVRPRRPAEDHGPREINRISLEEIKAGLVRVIWAMYVSDRQTVIVETARQFGYTRADLRMAERLNEALDKLIDEGRILEESGRLSLRDEVRG